jgi:hypothetical protein
MICSNLRQDEQFYYYYRTVKKIILQVAHCSGRGYLWTEHHYEIYSCEKIKIHTDIEERKYI